MTPDLLAAAGQVPKVPSDWLGWLVIIVVIVLLLRFVLRLLGILK